MGYTCAPGVLQKLIVFSALIWFSCIPSSEAWNSYCNTYSSENDDCHYFHRTNAIILASFIGLFLVLAILLILWRYCISVQRENEELQSSSYLQNQVPGAIHPLSATGHLGSGRVSMTNPFPNMFHPEMHPPPPYHLAIHYPPVQPQQQQQQPAVTTIVNENAVKTKEGQSENNAICMDTMTMTAASITSHMGHHIDHDPGSTAGVVNPTFDMTL